MKNVWTSFVRRWLFPGALALAAGGAGAQTATSPSVAAVPGKPYLLLGSYDLAPLGYRVDEYFLAGTASSYKLAGAPAADGRWNAMAAANAPYVTRVVVVRPTNPRKFNGTVVVEWLNVTAGTDASPDWNAAHRELLRGGYAYVAVSAQKVGIEGGPSLIGAGVPLKRAQPERYGRLSHPGDAFSYDIYSQAGRLFKARGASGLLGPLAPRRVIAMGESQSAAFLTTYVNAVDPVARVYDGFLIHSRFGTSSSLDVGAMSGPGQAPVKLRTDLRAPVITVETETDLLDSRIPGFHGARQPDNARLRIWEIAGTAHADNYTFGIGSIDSGSAPLSALAAGYKPLADVLGSKLAKPMNFAPQHHYVVEAALSHLDRWIRTGRAPPSASPISLAGSGRSGDPVRFALDANGLAIGGIRTPWVDVPTANLSGVGNSGAPLAFLVGIGDPFDAATLARLYPGGKREYLRKFEASLSSTIRRGFILPADRQEILALAPLTYHGPN